MTGAPSDLRFRPVEHLQVPPDDAELVRLRELAADLRAGEPALSAVVGAVPGVACGVPTEHGAMVVYEDHFELFPRAFVEKIGKRRTSLHHRARVLAGDGDLVILDGPVHEGFEACCRRLGLGEPELLPVPDTGRHAPIAERCLDDARTHDALVALARARGGLTLVPYVGTEHTWTLAEQLALDSGQPVRVLAAPAALAERCNDKLWFTERVREVLGDAAVPDTRVVHGARALGEAIQDFFADGGLERVVVKMPHAAAGLGNCLIAAHEAAGRAPEEVGQGLLDDCASANWPDEHWPLMVSAWEDPVAASPSVQLWVPPLTTGRLPIVQGVFTQRLGGKAGTFEGAVPDLLEPAVERRLAGEAVRLGCVLQALGYLGPCSLDALLVGESEDARETDIRWLECNGRWSGVSLPLTLVNRLVGDWHERPFCVSQHDGLAWSHVFDEVIAALTEANLLYTGASDSEGVVLLSPGGSGLHMVALARDARRAVRLADDAAELVAQLR